jgi:ribose transport system substrate-binding protein
MRKIVIPLVALAAIMVATTIARRAGSRDDGGTTSAAARAHSDQLYVEVSALGNLDYFYDHKLGMRLAGEHLGVRTEYIGPAEYDMPAMVTAFEQALARPNLKGVVVVGFEDVLVPIIDKAVDGGIPVVTVDADLPASKRIAFVGTGNYQAGREGGRALARLLGGRGKIAILTKPGQSNLEERVRGYRAAIAEHSGMEVVQVADTQSDATIAAQVAVAVLQRNPDLAGFACVEAAGGLGAATAVRERGLAGKVKIVAMDRGNDILELIGDGVIDATIAQQTALMPFYATQILFNLANSSVPVAEDNAAAGIRAVPKVIDTGVIVIDKDNCRHFLRK